MSREAIPGLGGITNRFGPRALPEGKGGVIKTEGAIIQVVLHFSGDNVNNANQDTLIIPAGFKPLRVLFETEVVGVFTGTTPVLNIGTSGSAATNGFAISEAQVEATGVYSITSFNGTWAAQLAAATTVGFELSGTSPVITSAGEFKVTIEGYLA